MTHQPPSPDSTEKLIAQVRKVLALRSDDEHGLLPATREAAYELSMLQVALLAWEAEQKRIVQAGGRIP